MPRKHRSTCDLSGKTDHIVRESIMYLDWMHNYLNWVFVILLQKMVKHFALCTTLQQKHTCVCHWRPCESVSLTQLGLGNHHHMFAGKGMFSNNMSIRTKGPPSVGVIHMMSHSRSQYSVSCQLLLLFSQSYSDCERWARLAHSNPQTCTTALVWMSAASTAIRHLLVSALLLPFLTRPQCTSVDEPEQHQGLFRHIFLLRLLLWLCYELNLWTVNLTHSNAGMGGSLPRIPVDMSEYPFHPWADHSVLTTGPALTTSGVIRQHCQTATLCLKMWQWVWRREPPVVWNLQANPLICHLTQEHF